MPDAKNTADVSVGDEISYRSMEGCTLAKVEGVDGESLELSNGKRVPAWCVLEVFDR